VLLHLTWLQGWVNEDKISRHAFPPSATTRVMVCGLPGVYDKLSGPRNSADVPQSTILGRLGYLTEMVIKF
jgi:cytochrome-b5 reductase